MPFNKNAYMRYKVLDECFLDWRRRYTWKRLLDDAKAYERMSKAVNPYGDGKACNRIVRILKGEQVDRYEV